MKSLFKLSIVFLAVMLGLDSFAQKIGFKAGFNFATMLAKSNSTTVDTKMTPGFHVGLTAKFPVSEIFSIESALQLTTKGMKYTFAYYDYRYFLTYLEIPLMAKAKITHGKFKLFAVLGPYFGYGLEGQTFGASTDYINWGYDNEKDALKPWDLGLNMGGGIEFKRMQLECIYGLGLNNISPYNGNGTKLKNRVLGISFGYWFG